MDPSFLRLAESSRFTLSEEVGSGTYGTVYAAFDRLRRERVAIKKISRIFDNPLDALRTLREIKLLRRMRHAGANAVWCMHLLLGQAQQRVTHLNGLFTRGAAADVVEIKHILLPPNPFTFNDLWIVMELMDSDLHTVIECNATLSVSQHRVSSITGRRGGGGGGGSSRAPCQIFEWMPPRAGVHVADAAGAGVHAHEPGRAPGHQASQHPGQ